MDFFAVFFLLIFTTVRPFLEDGAALNDREAAGKVVQMNVTEYAGLPLQEYGSREKQGESDDSTAIPTEEKMFQMPIKHTVTEEERCLGVAWTSVTTTWNFLMRAEYTSSSTPDNPVVKVTVNKGDKGTEEYTVNLLEINPKNASEIEMFALCNYADSIGKGIVEMGGSWLLLKTFRDNAVNNGYLPNLLRQTEKDSLETIYMDWLDMLEKMMNDSYQSGDFAQYQNGLKLRSLLEQFLPEENIPEEGTDDTPSEEELMEELRRQMDLMYDKLLNGETEERFPIGSSSFTLKEWREFLERFDSIEEALRELIKEEIAKRTEKAEETARSDDPEESQR